MLGMEVMFFYKKIIISSPIQTIQIKIFNYVEGVHYILVLKIIVHSPLIALEGVMFNLIFKRYLRLLQIQDALLIRIS